MLIAVILLLAVPRYAHAQNTTDLPYINSWHKYSVTMGAIGNNPEWKLFNTLANANANAAEDGINTFLLDAEIWIANNIKAAGAATIEIKFTDAKFVADQTWYLVYSEWDGTVGTGNCVARRSKALTMVDNSFYLTLSGGGSDCNSLRDAVLNWDNIDGLGLGHSGVDTKIPSSVDFTITMNKELNFVLTGWTFNGTITFPTPPANNYVYASAMSTDDIQSGTSNGGGAFTVADHADGTFSVTVDPPTINATSDYIVVRVYVSGLVYEDGQVRLLLSNGEAQSGTDFVARTDDDVGGDDHWEIKEILALPATSNISMSD